MSRAPIHGVFRSTVSCPPLLHPCFRPAGPMRSHQHGGGRRRRRVPWGDARWRPERPRRGGRWRNGACHIVAGKRSRVRPIKDPTSSGGVWVIARLFKARPNVDGRIGRPVPPRNLLRVMARGARIPHTAADFCRFPVTVIRFSRSHDPGFSEAPRQGRSFPRLSRLASTG